MAINPADAIRAFNRAASLGSEGMEARQAPQSSFLDTLEKVAAEAIDASRTAETMTAKAVVGQADLMDVVTAVTNAEMTLQTVVSVRDRVLNAYQEIMRMPI